MRTDKETQVENEELEESIDEKCVGCKYDKKKDGGYFCLCCVLIGEFTPFTK